VPPPSPRTSETAPHPSSAADSRIGVRADLELEDAVRRLIDAAAERDPPDAATPEVVVDVEVEGFRCILVAPRAGEDVPHVALSPREQEIARMVAKGYPNKTIAAVLEISSWTVSTHLRRVFAKLGVRTRAAMVARVLGERLIPDEPPEEGLERRLGDGVELERRH
jgi:DNA-binding CsgD family transcriptional regulator